MELTWTDPPPPAQTGKSNLGHRRSKYWKIFAELEKKPGVWAIIDPSSKASTHAIYALCRRYSLPFEVASRSNPDGTYAIYARRKENDAQEEE